MNGSLPLADESLEGRVLDVGCNCGEVLVVPRGRGLEVTGLEPNADALRRGDALYALAPPSR